jgi:REDY-like protein HapK
MRIIVLFNLKAGADVSAYEHWARERDLPGVRQLRTVAGFEVYRSTGLLGSDAAPPFAYVEIIDVADMAAFGTEVASDAVQKLAAEFRRFAEDPQFLLTERL